jgi:hypothetical protein
MDQEMMKAIAEQLMNGPIVKLEGQRILVRKTSRHRLKSAHFIADGREYEAIEQNPEKPSRWGAMAAEGRQVVQFRDVETNKYVGVVVDGKVTMYGR